MVRTKVQRSKTSANAKYTEVSAYMRAEFKEIYKKDMDQLNAMREQVLANIDHKIRLFKMTLPYPNKPLKEIQIMVNSTKMRTACETFEASSMHHESSKYMSGKKKRSLSCAPDDDGYLTGDSASSRATRASRTRSRGPAACSTTRVSRSLSRSRAQPLLLKNMNTKNQGYKTPFGKQPNKEYGMVTPKMQPNTPQLILRRPKQGEMAISMEGSPLMVNPVQVDRIANVNIPLGEGKLLSLQPERGLRVSQVPHLDEETQQQLKTLSDHIQKICAASKRM